MTAIAVCIFVESSAYSTVSTSAQQNSAIWPRILAVGLIICSVVLLIQTLFEKNTSESNEAAIDWKSTGMKKVYLTLGFILVFLVLNKIFGMLLALLFFIPAVEWIMGCKSKVMYVAFPLGIVAFIYVFFYLIMSVRLPQPFWA